jgi:hypothetical protein
MRENAWRSKTPTITRVIPITTSPAPAILADDSPDAGSNTTGVGIGVRAVLAAGVNVDPSSGDSLVGVDLGVVIGTGVSVAVGVIANVGVGVTPARTSTVVLNIRLPMSIIPNNTIT